MSRSNRDRDRKNANSLLNRRFRGRRRRRRGILNSLFSSTGTGEFPIRAAVNTDRLPVTPEKQVDYRVEW